MWQFLIALNKKLFLAIPVMMLLGYGYGLLFEPAAFKHAIMPLTFVMVYPMMVTLKYAKYFNAGMEKPSGWRRPSTSGSSRLRCCTSGGYSSRTSPFCRSAFCWRDWCRPAA